MPCTIHHSLIHASRNRVRTTAARRRRHVVTIIVANVNTEQIADMITNALGAENLATTYCNVVKRSTKMSRNQLRKIKGINER